ncbi:hypothetical protein [Magnetospirillum sp. XM-1]|uniref:PglD-related sugar-binding protein n=1 Tax=Magnetospirillum sp. XM-1 TaxID=1663591 RepID=UPI000838148E|nr:hypothetical protein [Magnetospirillum sp. XM-1]
MAPAIPLRIFGAGMRARVVADLLGWEFSGVYRLDGYYDDGRPADETGPGGAPILGSVEDGCRALAGSDVHAFIALGTYRSWRACEVVAELRRAAVPIARLVSPSAHVSPTAVIGDGALVMGGVFIGAEAVIGDLFTAHGGVTVEHHGVIGHNVLLAPGVSLCGCARIADHCFLGAGTSVIPEVRIGEGTMTGAGSVVVRDLPAGVVALGNPCRPLRPVGQGDEVPTPDVVARLRAMLPPSFSAGS